MKDETVETLIILSEKQPVQYDVSNSQYHVKETSWNEIMRITDEIKDPGIFPSPSFDDVSRKTNALRTYFVAEKKKWINPKQVELEVVVSYKDRWQLFVLLLFLADFVTPRNTQSNLERYQLSNPERKTEIKAVSNRGKPSKSDRTNPNCETTNRIGCGDFECIKA